MRQWYGVHRQTFSLTQGSASSTFLATATTSYYGAICYALIAWNGASVGGAFIIKEVDASATASLSNTVWADFFNTTYGSAYLNFGDEGLKASSVASYFRIVADTSGTVVGLATGYASPAQI